MNKKFTKYKVINWVEKTKNKVAAVADIAEAVSNIASKKNRTKLDYIYGGVKIVDSFIKNKAICFIVFITLKIRGYPIHILKNH